MPGSYWRTTWHFQLLRMFWSRPGFLSMSLCSFGNGNHLGTGVARWEPLGIDTRFLEDAGGMIGFFEASVHIKPSVVK